MTDRHETDANEGATISRRNLLSTTAGLVVGSTALAGLGAQRGAAVVVSGTSFQVRERNEDYVAAEVRVSEDILDEIKPLNDVYLGAAEQFVVHDDEDAVSLPEEPERLANPVAVKPLDTDETSHGKLMYFRSEDVLGYKVPDVTLGLGLFPERTVPGDKWDTAPGLWINVREFSEDYVTVEAQLPDGMSADDFEGGSLHPFLGPTDQFVIHEEEDAVSLPEDTELDPPDANTDGLAEPVEMDFENPHDVVMYFRTEDIAWPEEYEEGEEVTLGLGLFTERTIPGSNWDTRTLPFRPNGA